MNYTSNNMETVENYIISGGVFGHDAVIRDSVQISKQKGIGLMIYCIYNFIMCGKLMRIFFQAYTFINSFFKILFIIKSSIKTACISDTGMSKRTTVFEMVLKELNQQNIKHIIIKGMSYAKCYKNSEFRTMSDMDLVISPNDIDKADRILSELGGRLIYERSNDKVHYYKIKNTIIEIHTSIGYAGSKYAAGSKMAGFSLNHKLYSLI